MCDTELEEENIELDCSVLSLESENKKLKSQLAQAQLLLGECENEFQSLANFWADDHDDGAEIRLVRRMLTKLTNFNKGEG